MSPKLQPLFNLPGSDKLQLIKNWQTSFLEVLPSSCWRCSSDMAEEGCLLKFQAFIFTSAYVPQNLWGRGGRNVLGPLQAHHCPSVSYDVLTQKPFLINRLFLKEAWKKKWGSIWNRRTSATSGQYNHIEPAIPNQPGFQVPAPNPWRAAPGDEWGTQTGRGLQRAKHPFGTLKSLV